MARRPLTDEERYQRLADKRNKKAEQNHPLFAHAGLLHEVTRIWTADDVRNEIEGYARQREQSREQMQQRARQLREEFAALATAEELAEADDYWQRFQARFNLTPAYEAGYWRQALRDLRLRDKPVRVAGHGYRDAFGQLVAVTDLYTEGERWTPSEYSERKRIWEVYVTKATMDRPLSGQIGWDTQEEAQAELDRAAETAEWERVEVGSRGSTTPD